MAGRIARFIGGSERRDLVERDWMRGTLLMPQTHSGRSVGNEMEAFGNGAVFAAVNLLAKTISTIPLHVFQNQPAGGKQKATGQPIYNLLHDQPNPWMTSVEFFEAIMGHLALRGNAYLHLVRSGRGVAEIWPLRPDRMRIAREDSPSWYQPFDENVSGPTPGLRYYYTQTAGQEVMIPPSEIIHIRGLSYDGVRGYSVLRLARETIGMALATEEYGGRLFSNGAIPGGVLQTTGTLSEEGAKRLKSSFEEMHRGLPNSHRIAVLEEGLTWQSVGIDPEDAQFLQTRQFQIGEIARWFGVPNHLIGDLSRSTNNNIEQQSLEFVIYCMRPWAVRIERALEMALFGPGSDYSVRFMFDGLLRGDVKTRYASYAVGRQWGFLSVNDIRSYEDLDPIEGGDSYLQPLNMAPVDTLKGLLALNDGAADQNAA